jgi:GNAT superfamily N-acetyltransferase
MMPCFNARMSRPAQTTKIRPAVPGDENALAELNALVHGFHARHHPSFFKPADLPAIRAWFRDQLQQPTARIWIAEQAGSTVGYASVLRRERPENAFCHSREWLEIDQIGVRPEHQRRGIGRRLVQRVLQAAREEHIHHVELTSWCFNPEAHQAFARLGFSPSIGRFARETSGTSG